MVTIIELPGDDGWEIEYNGEAFTSVETLDEAYRVAKEVAIANYIDEIKIQWETP